jgi:hypothetical protein
MILVYSGKLYCNRWKTLYYIANAIKKINVGGVKFVLHIYTQDAITIRQNRLLNDKVNTIIIGRINPNELLDVYRKADILLHVESFDLKNRLLTKDSFSTKIVDYLQSSSALMVVASNTHTGFKYLQSEDAAFCVDSIKLIESKLREILDYPTLINDFAEKAIACGLRNHEASIVRNTLHNDFLNVITENDNYNKYS